MILVEGGKRREGSEGEKIEGGENRKGERPSEGRSLE